MLKNESERDGGQNTIKREQRVKGTDLVMGGERAVLSARVPHNERLNFLWPGWHTKISSPRDRGERKSRRESSDCDEKEGGRRNGNVS